MSSKYKSPIIRSRNNSTTSGTTSQNKESSPQSTNTNVNIETFHENLVYDNMPQSSPVSQNWRGRGCSSPRFNSPRPPKRSPYQWTSPNRFNNSWSSDQNNSGSFTSYEQNNYSFHGRPFNKYKKQNHNNHQNSNNEYRNESYFHPSMLEDPWAPLLANTR